MAYMRLGLFVVAALGATAMFAPWEKIIRIQVLNSSIELSDGSTPSPNMIAAIERATGYRAQTRAQVVGFRHGWQTGVLGWIYFLSMLGAVGLAAWWPSLGELPRAAPVGAAAAIALAAPAFQFAPCMQIAAWGLYLALTFATLLLALAIAGGVREWRTRDARNAAALRRSLMNTDEGAKWDE